MTSLDQRLKALEVRVAELERRLAADSGPGQPVLSIERLYAAWDRCRLPGLDFVELDRLGRAAKVDVEQLHNAIRAAISAGRVHLSSDNLAILAPDQRKWAYELQGRKLFLLAFKR